MVCRAYEFHGIKTLFNVKNVFKIVKNPVTFYFYDGELIFSFTGFSIGNVVKYFLIQEFIVKIICIQIPKYRFKNYFYL